MRVIPAILILVASFSICAFSQTPSTSKTEIDFGIPLSPLKSGDRSFSDYRGRWTLLFYFLPTCGHCQRAYPALQKLRATYEKKGLSFVAIASGSSQQDAIAQFDADFRLDMPAFKDVTREFGQNYGTGTVPLLLLVKPNGTFQSWTGFNESIASAMDSSIRAGLRVK